MRKTNFNQFTILLLMICSLIALKPVQAQGVDPFYSNLFNKGKESFFNLNYTQAIKELEIAAFGFPPENPIKLKAYIYISLSYYYLKDKVNSEKYYIKAKNNLGEKDLSLIELDEEVRFNFSELARIFESESQINLTYSPPQKQNLSTTEAGGNLKISPKDEIDPTKPDSKKAVDPEEELKEEIKRAPKNTALYYDLYNLYRERGDIKAAIKTLKNMTEKNPGEIDGYLLLGRIYFVERKYKDSMKNFEKIFDLSSKQPIAEPVLLEARAYLILTTFYKGDTKKAAQIAGGSLDIFTPTVITSLPLNQVQKNQLAEIISSAQPQPKKETNKNLIDQKVKETEAKEDREDQTTTRIEQEDAPVEQSTLAPSSDEISRIRAEIDKNPEKVSFYYELYEIYRREKNTPEAVKIIETLVKNNPANLDAHLLLSRLYFIQDKFEESLNSLDYILRTAEKTGIKRSLLLRTTIYTILCLYYLDEQDNLINFKEYLMRTADINEIEKIIQEEGLEEHREKIIQ